jgi:FkbM family methyltransferase
MNVSWVLSKLKRVSDLPRYLLEFPHFVRGYAKTKTFWGDEAYVPFPEFRSVVQTGALHEPAQIAYLDKNITAEDTFLDIGANFGFYSLLAASKGARVHAFEPFPSTFALLEKNKRPNMTLHKVAISDKSGSAKMKEHYWPGHNDIAEDGTVPISTITLDSLALAPTVIKIDVEKHEVAALKGGWNTITTYKPKIVMEYDSFEAPTMLKSIGYKETIVHKGDFSKNKPANSIFEYDPGASVG